MKRGRAKFDDEGSMRCARPASAPSVGGSFRPRLPSRMTGGDAIVHSLLRHGIDAVFGLFDAFPRNADRIRAVDARHGRTTACMTLARRGSAPGRAGCG
jgi:hypothetical protein